ncbi:uncharacterized protein LOC124946282 [Impatiens glandulifera]|uniref:uncharacterized protein LOC124946282 n=1 Tax=Impatiens glandulifera TaxID=253017 RepID=UPI001FB1216C|nr:uncharacterized protein LOC124946282 [Impatiens glandulifera]
MINPKQVSESSYPRSNLYILLSVKLEPFQSIQGRNALNKSRENITGIQSRDGLKELSSENKTAAVQEEVRRMSRLPSTSSYAVHRLKVLNKVLQLLSLQRNTSQEEELELLLASLSLS